MNASPTAAISITVTIEDAAWGSESHLEALAQAAVVAAARHQSLTGSSELGILFTDDASIRSMNAQWRHKDSPTNVLSFPAFPDYGGERLPPMLGDIVLARETVEREAGLEGKSLDHHVMHLIVHGFLHLLGHDHEEESEAEAMEAAERSILATLAIADPYGIIGTDN